MRELVLVVLALGLGAAVSEADAPPSADELRELAKTDADGAIAVALAQAEALAAADPLQAAAAWELYAELRNEAEGRRGRLETAEIYAKAIELRLQRPGEEPLALATSYREYGISFMIAGDYSEALVQMEYCLQLRRKHLSPDNRRIGQVLYNMATAAKRSGDYASATEYNQLAHENYQAAFGEGHTQLCYTLNQRANLMGDQGHLEEASRLYQETLEILRENVDASHPFISSVQANLSATLRDMGHYREALQLGQESLAQKEASVGEEHEDLLIVLLNLGVICVDMADYPGAREYYRRYLKIAESIYGPDHFEVAYALNNLSTVEELTGNYDAALLLLNRALEIKEKFAEERGWDLALALSNLGNEYVRRGEFEQGEPLLRRALTMREEIYGPDHPLVAATLAMMVPALRARGADDEALQTAQRALEIRLLAHGPDHPTVASSRYNIAVLALDRGDLELARASADSMLAADRVVLGDQHPRVARDLVARGLIRRQQGELAEAVDDLLLAEQLGADHLRLTIQSYSEREALAYSVERPAGLGNALAAAAESEHPALVQPLWDSLIRNRATVLEEMMRRRSHARSQLAEEFDLYEELQRASTRLANLVIRGNEDETAQRYAERLLVARLHKEDLERELAARSQVFRDLSSSQDVGYTDVAAALEPGDLLVAFIRYRHQATLVSDSSESYAALVLPARGQPELYPLGGSGRLDALVSSWRAEVEAGPFRPGQTQAQAEHRILRLGASLAERVIGPWQHHLPDARRLLVVPDGSLHQVNFVALPVNDQYLLEHDLLVQVLQAERDLLADSSPSAGVGLLAVGGAAYDAPAERADDAPVEATVTAAELAFRGATSSCDPLQSLSFVELNATGREVSEVAELWDGDAVQLAGADASESAFKRAAPGRAFLHLATHAFFLGDACDDDAEMGGLTTANQTPLLLSGLALAAANNRQQARGEDGILTAEEVAAMDLTGVRWAVLSACETGSGVLRASEGVLGLPRAFRVAGAATVIMSLWRVEDQAARTWMRSLYRGHLERGLDAASSVQYAARSILTQRREAGHSTHPFFWAAFISLGS